MNSNEPNNQGTSLGTMMNMSRSGSQMGIPKHPRLQLQFPFHKAVQFPNLTSWSPEKHKPPNRMQKPIQRSINERSATEYSRGCPRTLFRRQLHNLNFADQDLAAGIMLLKCKVSLLERQVEVQELIQFVAVDGDFDASHVFTSPHIIANF